MYVKAKLTINGSPGLSSNQLMNHSLQLTVHTGGALQIEFLDRVAFLSIMFQKTILWPTLSVMHLPKQRSRQ